MQRALLLLVVVAFSPRAAAAQGNPLGPEFRINTYTTSNQRLPAASSDTSGNFVVVWSSIGQDGSSFGVFGQRYATSGVPLGPEFRVNTQTTNYQYSPSVASGSTGNFVVVWESYSQDGSLGGVFGQRYASAGTPLGPEFRVNTYTTNFQGVSAVASDPAGNFVVVWASDVQDGSGLGIFGQRYAASGAPVGPEFCANSYTSGGQIETAVASDSSGNLVVVWTSVLQDGSSKGVFGQRYASTGAPLGPEFRVNSYTTNAQAVPSVAADGVGNFVVVWQSYGQDGDDYGVFGQRYASSGIPLGPEFRVNTYTSGLQGGGYYGGVGVASDSSGNFVVVWASSYGDGSNYGIFGQRYASSGTPLGSEFRVNTYTSSFQVVPAVASDASGNFVVVWMSAFDGDGTGAFGQRYSQIVPVELMHFRVE